LHEKIWQNAAAAARTRNLWESLPPISKIISVVPTFYIIGMVWIINRQTEKLPSSKETDDKIDFSIK
jgi:hypothetical protein